MTAERSDERIRYEISGSIACIGLARPPVNALDLPMVRGVIAALRRAAADDAVRAVVIASAVAKRFCAGLDIAELAGRAPDQIQMLVHEVYVGLFEAQYQLGKASIAAVNGAARGGGMTLAVSCDVVLAGASATFGYPEIDLGVPPAIHFVHLPRIVGRHRAFELLFSGRSFSAAEAQAIGLVSRVAPPAYVLDEARKLARVFAAKPANAMRLARAAFMRANDLDYRRGVDYAADLFCNIAATEEAREGIRAFAEKRPPKA